MKTQMNAVSTLFSAGARRVKFAIVIAALMLSVGAGTVLADGPIGGGPRANA